jgi:predicted transcriptional regulator
MNDELVELTADIVSAYVSKNAVPTAELAGVIASVHQSLRTLKGGTAAPMEEQQTPSVNPKRSVHNDYIVCLEDGKKYKSLKRHLATHHGMSPNEYRAKWGLPSDYPMVAPAYAAARAALAKSMGLGRKSAAKPAPRARKAKA